MTTKKLQLLVTSCIPSDEKESILRTWNISKQVRVALGFPIEPFSDALFLSYLHRYVFWYQLKVAALELFDAMFRTARKAPGKSASLSFAEYIEESRLCHWDFAFMEQIKCKQINKSIEWGSSKNIHGQGAMRRLLYRYWTHIL